MNPNVTILDVGHGNAAILTSDAGFVVFDAGPNGHLHRYLREKKIETIEAMLLSHADVDHVRGAISVLLDPGLHVKHLFINPDPSKKDNHSFEVLRLAIFESERERGTITEPHITTSLSERLMFGDVAIQVLYPPPDLAVGGIGGSDHFGKPISSNSLSAVLRLMYQGQPRMLFGGDCGQSCLSIWEERKIDAAAPILIYPHHGGQPGTSDVAAFASQLGQRIQPEVVIFSVHRTRFGLPRQDVIDSLVSVLSSVRFVCTQLPDRYASTVASANAVHWALHRTEDEKGIHHRDGNIHVSFQPNGYRIRIGDDT